MPDETVAAALAALSQPTDTDALQLAGSMSQSGVYKVRLNNLDAVLKINSAAHASMLAALLTTMVFGWPEYAHHHSTTEQERTTRHLIDLLDEWHNLTA